MSDLVPTERDALRVLALVDEPAHYSARVRSSIPFNALQLQRIVKYKAISFFNATDIIEGITEEDAKGIVARHAKCCTHSTAPGHLCPDCALRAAMEAEEKPRTIGQKFLQAYFYPSEVVQWSLASTVQWLKYMPLIQRSGKPFVMDLDDDLWAVSPFSNTFIRWGTYRPAPVQIATASNGLGMKSGDWFKHWLDQDEEFEEDGKKVKFDIEANKRELAKIEAAIRAADAVTVTTEVAAKRFREWNEHVYVLPNYLDGRCWQPGRWRTLPDDGCYRVGWYGGSSHKPDLGPWTGAGEALGRFAAAHPEVRVVIGGILLPEVRHHVPAKQIEFHEWICADAHPFQIRCMGLDHGIAPVCDMKFNYAKSPIKWTELSALAVPTSCSNHTPYREHVRDGEDGFLVEDGVENWLAHLERVYGDEVLRRRVGLGARARFAKDFEANANAENFMEAYYEIWKRGPKLNPAPVLELMAAEERKETA